MRILSIETSCDETAISIIETTGTYPHVRISVLGNVLLSQAALHAEYGGVFPNLARREHTKNLVPILDQVLKDAGLAGGSFDVSTTLKDDLEDILAREEELYEPLIALLARTAAPALNAIAVTYGPGLEPALWVGINFARALGRAWNVPLVPIDHMEGHMLVALLEAQGDTQHFALKEVAFPMLTLLVSGGHTELVLAKDFLSYELVGETRDDAAGEAYDKVARMLELPYPGGPEIARRAEKGQLNKAFALPRPMLDSGDYDFSFSGLKTAVLYKLKELPELSEQDKADLCREFQEAVTEVLVKKTVKAACAAGARTVTLGGGVSANTHLREALTQALKEYDITFVTPDPALSTDNALMIATAAYLRIERTGTPPPSPIAATGNLRIGKKTSLS